MSLRDNELARRQDGRVLLRPQPLRVRWSFNDLATADGHELRVAFTASVRAIPDPTERRMLEEVLLGSRYALSESDVAAHFAPALRTALGKLSDAHDASQWVSDELKPAVVDALRAAAKPVAFGCGLELLPPFELDSSSPTFQQQRLRGMQQSLAEQQTAGQMQHFHRAAELLKQFQEIRHAAPELSPGRVLQQISPSDRGAVLESLLMGASKQEQADSLWAVAGPYLVKIDARTTPSKPLLIPLPPTLGPLRSVQAADAEGTRKLLVGARSGFMVVDPQSPNEPQLYADDGIESALGFNRVVYWGPSQGFVASHGDAGIVRWEAGRGDAPATTIRAAQIVPRDLPQAAPTTTMVIQTSGPRNVQVLDEDKLVFSIGASLFVSDGSTPRKMASASEADIVAILPDDKRMIVVHEDGTLCLLDRSSAKIVATQGRGSRVRAAGELPWLGTTRVLLGGDDGPVACIGFDDQLVTQYASPHRGLRVITGSADVVAAVSGDRQRLILWSSWDGRQPVGELFLTGLTRHRVADICFG